MEHEVVLTVRLESRVSNVDKLSSGSVAYYRILLRRSIRTARGGEDYAYRIMQRPR